MPPHSHTIQFRVRYGETDQMGTFYNARVLDWFEIGRTELMRSLGTAYAEMERRGAYLPVVEAHVRYLGRAQYDDLLELTASGTVAGKARVRFDIAIRHARGDRPVAEGHTVHAVTDQAGRPARPPQWLTDLLSDPTE